MGRCYYPRAFRRQRNAGHCYETNTSTQTPPSCATARFPGAHEHPERPRDAVPPPPQGPETARARVTATLRQHERVRHGAEFRRARADGRKVVGRMMLLNVLRADNLTVRRLGVVTSRKIGGAVARNRARRVMREAWRLIKDRIAPPCDIVIVARRGIVGKSMMEVQGELVGLLKNAGVMSVER